MASKLVLLPLLLLAVAASARADAGRKLLQNTNPNAGATITVSASNPNVNAIAITPSLPYPQTGIFCNVSGDSRLQVGAFFPLTVRVPVGVTSEVIFANVTGTIPGTGSCSSVVQQPGSSVVQQPGTPVVQQPGTSVVQQPNTSVVQQPGTQVVQPGTSSNCTSSVVQQPSSVVQQTTSVVQQPGTPGVVQNTPPSTVVQQPKSTAGKKLLATAAPIEYISNNGSMGQPLLSVTDTVEGVPNISFKPTSAGQVAQFVGALQVAVTTTNNGLGTPYIPYRVDPSLSPNCGVTVKFVAV